MLKTRTLTFDRTAEGYHQAGEWVEGAITKVLAEGSLQPLNRRTYQVNSTLSKEVEDRGMSSSDIRVFYTETELRTAEEYTNTSADITYINSIPYEPVLVNPWTELDSDLEHYEVFLAKKRGAYK